MRISVYPSCCQYLGSRGNTQNAQAYSEIASDPPRRAVGAHPLELHIANLFLPVEGMFMSWAHDLRKQKSYTLVHLRLTKENGRRRRPTNTLDELGPEQVHNAG